MCAGYYATPLWDGDFWWHIAAGSEILTSKSLPSEDPFGVFSTADTVRNNTMLKSEWLGQVLLYLLFDTGAENAVIAFRVTILLSCIILIYLRCRWLKIESFALWLVLTLVGFNAYNFLGERPQLLSFLFAALFFVVIDRAEQKKDWRWLILLPLIAVIWANCHGGVLLGVALIGFWSLLKCSSSDSNHQEKMIWFATACAVVLASITTPNGIQTYLYLFDLENSVLQSRTSEYVSAFQLHTLVGHRWSHIWIYAYYAAAISAVVTLMRLKLYRPMAIIFILGAISASAFRYFIFFLIVAAPYIALGLQTLMRESISFSRQTKQIGNGLLVLVLVIMLTVGTARGMVFRGGLDELAYPVAIADFIDGKGLQGRAFNNMEWGGYLLWRLAPKIQLYIDGRMLDGGRLLPYTHILWATKPGIEWFERENFQLVILPYHGRYDPEQYKLIDYLNMHMNWRLIYRDPKGVIFERH